MIMRGVHMGRKPQIVLYGDGMYEVDTGCDFVLGTDLTVFSKLQEVLCLLVVGKFLEGRTITFSKEVCVEFP